MQLLVLYYTNIGVDANQFIRNLRIGCVKGLQMLIVTLLSRGVDWRKKLRQVTQDRGLQHTDLTRRCGIKHRTFQNWIGRNAKAQEPKVSTSIRLAKALNLTVEQLFDADTPLPEEGKYKIRRPGTVADAERGRDLAAGVDAGTQPHKPQQKNRALGGVPDSTAQEPLGESADS
jgi:DNA-binding XRE family transcriptional regulator